MSEWIKIALKAGLVAIMMAALWGLWTALPSLPVIPQEFWDGLGMVKAVGQYYIPGFDAFLLFVFAAFGLRVAGLLYKITSNALKWLYQVFE